MNTPWRPVRYYRACTQGAATVAYYSTLLMFLLLLSPAGASAGGGPETTLLVVNADSPLSLRIANEYVRLRDIPETNVLWLHGIPSTYRIPIKIFRERIWQPISEFIRINNLEDEIDAIIYSADFPYGVKFTADLKIANQPKHKYVGSIASLTSLTYFARRVAVGDTGYLGKNHYFRDFAEPTRKPVDAVASFPRLTEKQVKTLRKEARGTLRQKQYDKAIGIYRKLLASHPQSAQNWHDLARSLAAAGRETEAITALSNSVDSGWINRLEIQNDKYLKALRGKPAFAELMRRMDTAFQPILLSRGFRNYYVWSDAGLQSWDEEDFKDQYYLSTLLAYTGVRGNSFPEVMNYLRTAAASDGTQPDGTVYLMENSNIRSKTRQHLFVTTLDELAKRGRKGEILSKRIPGQNGIIPMHKTDIIGLVVGSPTFDWEKGQSQLLAGAIAESLTSYGGAFNSAKQTKLTEFLRRGAAGSSGAVAEPYSFQEKFPVPLLHTAYADGCSLAEAFYQSVEYPYQLIIVGDPLARPYARFAKIALASPDTTQPWSGTVSLRPTVHAPTGSGIKAVELWIDGQRLSSAAVGEEIEIDTRNLANGAHRLRLVAVQDSIIETRSYARFDIQVRNNAAAVAIDPAPRGVTYGDDIQISGSAPDGADIVLFQGRREHGSATPVSRKWNILVPSSKLGLGPVSLHVRATLPDGTKFRSASIALAITEPARLPAFRSEPPLNKGLSVVIYDKQGATHRTTVEQLNGARLPGTKKIKTDRVSLGGFFNVDDAGFYQLVIKTTGHIMLSINDHLRLDTRISKLDGESYLPLSLEAGWHKLHIELDESRRNNLKMLLAGDQIPEPLGGDSIGH